MENDLMSSKTHPLLKDAPHKELLLGNDAYVRGMIEAGVKVAAAYPGSPVSEIGVRLSEEAQYLSPEVYDSRDDDREARYQVLT